MKIKLDIIIDYYSLKHHNLLSLRGKPINFIPRDY